MCRSQFGEHQRHEALLGVSIGHAPLGKKFEKRLKKWCSLRAILKTYCLFLRPLSMVDKWHGNVDREGRGRRGGGE